MGVLILATLLLIVVGCAPHSNLVAQSDVGAGFWMGTWHGFIAPFTLIGSIFTDVGVYEIQNVGFWYNAGFLTGLGLIFGIFGTATEGVGAVFVLYGAIAVTILRGLFDLALIFWALRRRP